MRFKPARRFLLRRVIPPIGLALIRSLGWSWRYRVLHRERLDELQATKRPTVAGFFHGRTFPLLGFMSGRGNGRWMVMCSKSLDGDAMATIEQRLGFEVIRGSSGTDGLQAIIDMIRRARTDPGLGSCLAVDGSRGPRGEVQGGVIAIAQRTGGVVLPVTAAAKPALVFKRTWDHTMLPLPFARVVVAIGEPVEVPKTLSTEALAQLCKDVERRMELLQEEADDELAGKRSGPAGPVTAAVGRPDPSGDESAVTR
ncbi:MAG: lysophospholipid acyltransferase family protein [bacterium]|nr:lysophospholipid acyltransferase family protein [bacterium]